MNAKRWTLAILMMGALLLPGLPAAAQKKGVGEPVRNVGHKEKGATEIFFCGMPTSECRSSTTSFELKQTRDLYVYVTWPGVAGDHVQTVEFYLPDGSLYVKKDTPFRVQASKTRAWQMPGGKLPEKYFTTSRGVPAVATQLGVEGTYITQRNLTGNWSVRVLLDGKPVSTANFSLQPAAPR